MGKYRTLGTFFDRIFRNDLNANFNDIDTDVKAQKKRVDDLIVANPQPSEVQDARGGFTVLRDRLNDTDAQLADIVINARSYGVKGDGSDDLTKIQQAIDYVSSKGGGTVLLLPNKTHGISAELVLPSNVHLKGNNTILKALQGTGAYMIRNSDFSASGFTGNNNITVEGIIFDGNNLSTGGIGIAHTEGVSIINNTFRNFVGSLHGVDATANKNIKIKGNRFYNIEATMCQIDQALSGSIPTNLANILNEDATSCLGVTIEENYFMGGVGAVHIHKNGHSFVAISRNLFEDCQIGIVDDSTYTTGHSYITISGNELRLTGATTSGHGIVLHSGISNLNIEGNQIKPKGIGIILSDDSTREHVLINITNNHIREGNNSGIICEKVKRANIINNTIYGFGDGVTIFSGIKMFNSDTFTIDSNFIGGLASDVKRYGVYLDSCENFNVTKNKLSFLDVGIYGIGTATKNIGRGTISENLLTSMLNYGIHVIGVSSATLINFLTVCKNIIKTVTNTHGIRIQYCDKGVVTENQINGISNNNSAISLSTFVNGSVANNICFNSALTTSSYGVAVSGTNCGNTIISGNNVSGFATGIGAIAGANKCIVSSNITIGCTTSVDVSGGINNVQANNIAA